MKLLLLTILIMIDSVYMGDKELEKRIKNVDESSSSTPMIISHSNRTMLDAYHTTDPYSKGHNRRMAEKLHDSKPKNLRQRAKYLIESLCKEWYRITRLNKEETRDLLNRVFLSINTHRSDIEDQMRIKLLEIRPDLRVMDPEIPRSIVHDWHRFIEKGGRIRSREDEADLVHTYNEVKYGEGQVHERLAQKWKQFHPHLSNYKNRTLLNMANELSHDQNEFTPEEMKRARERYESVFGAESEKGIRNEPMNIISRVERIRTREEGADLLYTYYQVQSGPGLIEDRLANKWKQFRPRLGNYKKGSLLKRVHHLSRAHPEFSPEEMEAAKIRYESIFGAESGKNFEDTAPKKRASLTDEQANDLLYLTILYRKKKFSREEFKSYWEAMHPEFAFKETRDLCDRRDFPANWNRKRKLTPEEETAAKSRLKAALAQRKQDHQMQMFDEQGGSSALQSSHGQELHQQSPDWTISHPPTQNSLQLSEEELNDMEMWMNCGVTNHLPTSRYSPSSYHYGSFSPTALSPFPDETSHSRYGLSNYDPYTANPYYEHGSSSHSHYDTHTHDPQNDPNTHNPHYDPNTYNPNYEHGSSSHSHYDPYTANPRYKHGNSSHSHDKPHQ